MESINLSRIELEIINVMLKHDIDNKSELAKDLLEVINQLRLEQRNVDEIKYTLSSVISKL